jgi:polyisoprenoid-binding protein YceI
MGADFGRQAYRERNRLMKLFRLAAVFVLAAPLAFAQTTTWTPDAVHSEIDFAARHMQLTTVHGRMGKVTGTIQINDADLTKSSIQITVDVAGVDSGVAMRDNDLRGASFFDATQYPTATFTSTGIAKSASGYTVNGNLTLHGVTKPVTLDMDAPVGPVNGMGGKQHMGFSGTATISRAAFGIGTKVPTAVVGDDIKLTIEIDAVKQ